MQRYFGIKKTNDSLILEDGDYHHIKNVMRKRDGDFVEVVIDEKLYLGCIENVKSDVNVKLIKKLDFYCDVIPFVNLIIPLLQESKMDLILQKAAELGVKKITVCPFKRCMVKANSKIDNKLKRWQKILKEASEQSFRIDIPEVVFINNINLLEDLTGIKIVCSTKKVANNLKMVLTNLKNNDIINIVIGPEGGLDTLEEDYLNDIDFASTTLGSRIMRVESVPLFVMSCINYEYME